MSDGYSSRRQRAASPGLFDEWKKKTYLEKVLTVIAVEWAIIGFFIAMAFLVHA